MDQPVRLSPVVGSAKINANRPKTRLQVNESPVSAYTVSAKWENKRPTYFGGVDFEAGDIQSVCAAKRKVQAVQIWRHALNQPGQSAGVKDAPRWNISCINTESCVLMHSADFSRGQFVASLWACRRDGLGQSDYRVDRRR